jgi:hypothetical protein
VCSLHCTDKCGGCAYASFSFVQQYPTEPFTWPVLHSLATESTIKTEDLLDTTDLSELGEVCSFVGMLRHDADSITHYNERPIMETVPIGEYSLILH